MAVIRTSELPRMFRRWMMMMMILPELGLRLMGREYRGRDPHSRRSCGCDIAFPDYVHVAEARRQLHHHPRHVNLLKQPGEAPPGRCAEEQRLDMTASNVLY